MADLQRKTANLFRGETNLTANAGSTALPYEPYGWVHSLRKLTTATEAVENPLYSDGTAITAYTIKGNTTQSGTPSPDNPIMPQGTGDRTRNLFIQKLTGVAIDSSGEIVSNANYDTYIAEVSDGETYTVSNVTGTQVFGFFTTKPTLGASAYNSSCTIFSTSSQTLTVPTGENIKYIGVRYNTGVLNAMLNTGSTPLPYEPYGYKIPISNGQQTTNIYLGSTQTVRQIKKLVLTGDETGWVESLTNHGYRFGLNVSDSMQSDTTDVRSLCTHLPLTVRGGTGLDVQNVYVISATRDLIIKLSNSDRLSDLKTWLSQQYANGTPVTVWYVLATPETAAVNEPLMKIGTYADSISNAVSIPTTDGANSITVDTTVQPSEFSATWAGWHDSSVKEWDGSQWD